MSQEETNSKLKNKQFFQSLVDFYDQWLEKNGGEIDLPDQLLSKYFPQQSEKPDSLKAEAFLQAMHGQINTAETETELKSLARLVAQMNNHPDFKTLSGMKRAEKMIETILRSQGITKEKFEKQREKRLNDVVGNAIQKALLKNKPE